MFYFDFCMFQWQMQTFLQCHVIASFVHAMCCVRVWKFNHLAIGCMFNPHDPCIANKMIDNKQHTICFHVDDIMASHVAHLANDKFAEWLNSMHAVVNAEKQSRLTETSTTAKEHNTILVTTAKSASTWKTASSQCLMTSPSSLTPVHCVKSYMRFELFVNENYKLQNEAKMNVTFERGSARDPRHSPLSTEMNDASTWRIGMPDAQFVMTLFTTIARFKQSRTKRVLIAHNGPKDAAVALVQTSVPDNSSLLFWAMFFTTCEWQGQQQLGMCAEKRMFREWVPDEWVPCEDAPLDTWFRALLRRFCLHSRPRGPPHHWHFSQVASKRSPNLSHLCCKDHIPLQASSPWHSTHSLHTVHLVKEPNQNDWHKLLRLAVVLR